MALYLISYDLRQKGQDYSDLKALLEQWKAKRILQSVWMLKNPDMKAVEMKEALIGKKGPLDSNDGVIVAMIADSAYAHAGLDFDPSKL